jgi:hypothetical protein
MDIAEIDAQQERIATAATARYRDIESDASLSDVGKLDAMREVEQSTSAKLDELEAQRQQAHASRLGSLRTSLFGVPHYADDAQKARLMTAQDRASQITTVDAAERELRLAHGDRIRERALLERAVELGWHRQDFEALVERYVAENPSVAEDLREFLILSSPEPPQSHIERQMRTRPSKPARLRNAPRVRAGQR